METFTGTEYLKIDIANSFGLDKELFPDRIDWTEQNLNNLESLIPDAESPFLFSKAVTALRLTEAKVPIKHIMYLDATASGPQIMAALSGCHKTAFATNMIDPKQRVDLYAGVVAGMNAMLLPIYHVDRELIKKPVMTH